MIYQLEVKMHRYLPRTTFVSIKRLKLWIQQSTSCFPIISM